MYLSYLHWSNSWHFLVQNPPPESTTSFQKVIGKRRKSRNMKDSRQANDISTFFCLLGHSHDALGFAMFTDLIDCVILKILPPASQYTHHSIMKELPMNNTAPFPKPKRTMRENRKHTERKKEERYTEP
jgi:hypothetical protein